MWKQGPSLLELLCIWLHTVLALLCLEPDVPHIFKSLPACSPFSSSFGKLHSHQCSTFDSLPIYHSSTLITLLYTTTLNIFSQHVILQIWTGDMDWGLLDLNSTLTKDATNEFYIPQDVYS